MKKVLLFIVLLSTSYFTGAQCNVPTGNSFTVDPANCIGKGKVTVRNVTGGVTGNSFEYELVYDSVGNTSIVKAFQSDSVFVDVFRGRYKVNIRAVCPAIGISAPFTSASVVVDGITDPLGQPNTTVNSNATCGLSNGSFTVSVSGGNTAIPYQYALVSSVLVPEPVATYVRPKQPSNVFANLSSGTYYVRVYDGCGNYSNATCIMNSVTEAVSIASNPTVPYSSAPYLSSNLYYGCDSLLFAMQVGVNYKSPATAAQDPSERFWIRYNGVTDTFSNATFVYDPNIGNGSNAVVRKMITGISYPAIVTYGFKSVCGNVYSKTDTISKPVMGLEYVSTQVSCSKVRYAFIPTESQTHAAYANTWYSNNNGTTWTPFNTGTSFIDTLDISLDYSIIVAGKCDTARLTLHVEADPFDFFFYPFTAYSCDGRSGFALSVNQTKTSILNDSILFKVLSQPTGAGLPDSFYFVQQSKISESPHGFALSYNLPAGTYQLKATNQCGATSTQSLTINPNTLSYTITENPNCTPSLAGFTIVGSESNYQPQLGSATFLRARITNTVTGAVDSFPSATTQRPATINVVGLPNGIYAVELYRVAYWVYPWNAFPLTTCATLDTIYTNQANNGLGISQAYFTTTCGNTSSTITALAQGGGGNYVYRLNKKNASGNYILEAGPQAIGLFNNLQASVAYEVRVQDACGNDAGYELQVPNSDPYLFLNGITSPCPGDPVTFKVPPYPNASYEWFKNGAMIAGQTGDSYSFNPMTTATDTFKVGVNLGNCLIYTNDYVLSPINCGIPLPLSLIAFGGHLLQSGEAQLNWEIVRSLTTEYFEPEYSTDGKTFYTCGAKIQCTDASMYNYVDKARESSKIYYRLKIMDKLGAITYSTIITLDRNKHIGTNITIYPSVASDAVHVSYSNLSVVVLPWSIIDMQGRIVKSGMFNVNDETGVYTINGLSGLTEGTYILHLDNVSGIKYNTKFVIRH